MYCNRCSSSKHYAANCPKPSHRERGVVDRERRTPEADVAAGESPALCSGCGSTAQTFADAKRWAVIRDKQRARMKQKRKQK